MDNSRRLVTRHYGYPQPWRTFPLQGLCCVFSVSAMNTFTDLVDNTRGHIDALEHFDAYQALDAGIDPATVKNWKTIHATYFGPTTCPAQQRLGRELARSHRVSLAKLGLIERLTAHVTPASARWALRHELLTIPGQYNTLKAKAKDIVPPKEAAPPEKGLWCSQTSRGGVRGIRINADERFVADLDNWLSQATEPGSTAGVTSAQQRLEKFIGLVRGPHSADSAGADPAGGDTDPAGARGVPVGVYRPIIAVPIHAWIDVQHGANVADTVLTATDGTSITLGDLVNEALSDVLEVGVFHPHHGPLGLFRGERAANDHQRDLLMMAHPECVWLGCHVPAVKCQMHHIEPWKHGGQTNIDNLVPLCAHHNGANDDDPDCHRRGEVDNVPRTVGWSRWISPRGYVVETTPEHSIMRQLYGDPPPPPEPPEPPGYGGRSGPPPPL